MFGKKHKGRRSTNIVFVIFRLALSLVMFGVLLVGVYSAYKHFSGLDPLKLDPQAVVSNLLKAKTPRQFLSVLSSLKLTQGFSDQMLGQSQKPAEEQTVQNPAKQITNSPLAFKFLLFADSHNDNVNLKKALTQAKQDYPDLKFIIGLGDYTDVGTLEELRRAKNELDNSGLRYFLIMGDHDLWDCRNRSLPPDCNFTDVFGPRYQSFEFDNFFFLLLDNSDNYLGLGMEQIEWISTQLQKAKDEGKVKGKKTVLAFIHEPLYHPSSDHAMGRVEKNLKSQAKSLIFELKEAGVKEVFSGDIHYFSQYEEPETKLTMYTVGAVTVERNPQAPRFAVVSVFEDGSTKVGDVEIR